jgi:bacterioferritin-associated ferredoxin
MYVCVCRAVTDKQVEAAIEAGARTVQDVTKACCAGDDCGACHQVIEGMIEDAREGESAVRHLPVVRERAA